MHCSWEQTSSCVLTTRTPTLYHVLTHSFRLPGATGLRRFKKKNVCIESSGLRCTTGILVIQCGKGLLSSSRNKWTTARLCLLDPWGMSSIATACCLPCYGLTTTHLLYQKQYLDWYLIENFGGEHLIPVWSTSPSSPAARVLFRIHRQPVPSVFQLSTQALHILAHTVAGEAPWPCIRRYPKETQAILAISSFQTHRQQRGKRTAFNSQTGKSSGTLLRSLHPWVNAGGLPIPTTPPFQPSPHLFTFLVLLVSIYFLFFSNTSLLCFSMCLRNYGCHNSWSESRGCFLHSRIEGRPSLVMLISIHITQLLCVHLSSVCRVHRRRLHFLLSSA